MGRRQTHKRDRHDALSSPSSPVTSGTQGDNLVVVSGMVLNNSPSNRDGVVMFGGSVASDAPADLVLDIDNLEEIGHEQVPLLLRRLRGNVLSFALESRGCRVVQRALE